MNNLFALAANEVSSGSVFFLNSIFGNVGNVLGGSGPALLGSMFKVFNTTVLALGSLIVTYNTIVGILLTAHEGQALGKDFHGIWIPLRTVGGIAALVPTASGYSYLQIGLMWFILQGVGAADTLWTSTLAYVAGGGSTVPNTPSASSATAVGLQLNMGVLFEALTCQAAAKANYGSGYFCADYPTTPFCKSTDTDMLSVAVGSPQVAGNVYSMGPSGVCGSLALGDPSSTIGQAQNQAFQQIVPTLGSLASQLVGVDYAYTSFVNAPLTTPGAPPSWVTQYCANNNLSGTQCNAAAFTAYQPPTPTKPNDNTVNDLYWNYGLLSTAGGNFLLTAASLYSGIVGAAIPTASNSGTNLNNVLSTAENNGWIYAGGYFYYIAAANNAVSTNVGTIHITPPTQTDLSEPTEQALMSAATTIVTLLGNQTTQASNNLGISTSCGSSSYSGGGNALCSAILGSWVSNLSGSSSGGLSQNPVIAAQGEGNDILNAVEIVIPIMIALAIANGILGAVVLGTSPWVAASIVLEMVIMPIAMFVILIFLGLGLTLAVYTPMIPYMLFTFGVINWFIGTIETMIAAPLVAIGLLHPEGGHNIWGKAEKALMLMLSIFLRPTLMIFGMIGGMLLSYTVVMMINYAFLNVVAMVSPGSNVIEMIFFMVLYTSIFTTSMNKCFALIHLIPDQVLRWIGGEGTSFGEQGGLEKVGEAFQAASQKASQAAEGSVAGAGKLGSAAGKYIKGKMGGKGADNAAGGIQAAPPVKPPKP